MDAIDPREAPGVGTPVPGADPYAGAADQWAAGQVAVPEVDTTATGSRRVFAIDADGKDLV